MKEFLKMLKRAAKANICMVIGHDYVWESRYDFKKYCHQERYGVKCTKCNHFTTGFIQEAWQPKIKPKHEIFFLRAEVDGFQLEKEALLAEIAKIETDRKKVETTVPIIKLASLVVHFDEMCYGLIPAEKEDFTLCRSMLNDPDIQAILIEFDRDSLLPIRRDQARYKDRIPTRKC